MRVLKLVSISLLAILMWSASCKDAAKSADNATGSAGELTVAFYNVENIFDTEDDPNTLDDDFTPQGKLEWTEDKYRVKLQHFAEAIAKIDADYPDVIGLCEIENRKVLEDMIAMPGMKEQGYRIVHRDSPDERGIDVALLYKSSVAKLVHSDFLRIDIPEDPEERTREILYARLNTGGEDLDFFVNHWPSRSGGQVESEFKRIAAARTLKAKVDEVNKDGKAKVICIGDFNDHPDNKSIMETLDASNTQQNGLYNLSYDGHRSGIGSYWYKGEWGALDQCIVTPVLLSATKGWSVSQADFRFVKDPALLFTDSKGVARPNRTYVGDDYKGGYSDHLPIAVILRKR